jgi:hypothetical protein
VGWSWVIAWDSWRPASNDAFESRPRWTASRRVLRSALERGDLDVGVLQLGLVVEDLPVVRALLALDCVRRAAGCAGSEEILGGLASDHAICHRIGMLLVRVARRADAALELDTGPLLDHVGRLMGDGV